MMRRIFRTLLLLGVLLVAAAVGGYFWAEHQIKAPGPLTTATTIVIPKGAGADAIARLLQSQGVISQPLLFRLALRLDDSGKPLRAGEYEIPAGISVTDLLALLQSGKTVMRKLTIAEGLTVAEILALVRAQDGLEGQITLKPAEGSLLPQTYFFTLGDSRDAVVQRMRQAMKETLEELWAKRKPGLPIDNEKDAVTLASIVEKETGVASERPRVAAVFVNRLRLNMRLESDPTVTYGITHGLKPLGRDLTRADLQAPSPYNTYTIAGLPPGPIANPGRASLEAALNPLDTKEIYFVADGTGGHAFAETLEQHNKNVAAWRKLRDSKKP
jgi:UPF0755 protein